MTIPINLSALDYERQMSPADCTIDYHGNSVVSGCEVTASDQRGFTVCVTPGIVRVNGRVIETAGAACLHVAAADASHHRLDLVVIDQHGHVSIIKGAASNRPRYPQTSFTQCVLASVYIPPINTFCEGIDDSLIIDRAIRMQTMNHVLITAVDDQAISTPTKMIEANNQSLIGDNFL